MTEYKNHFGQKLKEYDWVGWGGRDGNSSKRQVGVVEKFKTNELTRWDYHTRKDVVYGTEDKAYVAWYGRAGGYHSTPIPHRSWVLVKDLFLVDPNTLDQEIVGRYVPF